MQTLITSNGCVASVAMPPADAADNACTIEAWPLEFTASR